MPVLTLGAALTLAATCSNLPAYLQPLAVGLAMGEGHGQFNTDSIGHNTNGTTDYGASQINTINLGWLGHTPITVMDPCNNLLDGVKVFFAKYNGNPPDAVKAAYAAAAVKQVGLAANTPTPLPPTSEPDDPSDPKPYPGDIDRMIAWTKRHQNPPGPPQSAAAPVVAIATLAQADRRIR